MAIDNRFGKPIRSICHEYLKLIVQDLQVISICGHVFHELCWLVIKPKRWFHRRGKIVTQKGQRLCLLKLRVWRSRHRASVRPWRVKRSLKKSMRRKRTKEEVALRNEVLRENIHSTTASFKIPVYQI
ncbi:uncharacterized protein LOC123222743 isoform X2 [Mangifera indica]|uniref:uncharacterized protein LOC123222743 isoform X2 n=1 Tax=Mangifera indica TaxID=29780 RepID=UPI001CFC25CA|nr:uncharacterized protein LOC123222743 isoform X2 [Mangifera indica]